MNQTLLTSTHASPVEAAVSQSEALFEKIAGDIANRGYSINPAALPPSLATDLLAHQALMDTDMFNEAGIGRGQDFMRNDFVRTDKICWITGESATGRQWLEWTESLRLFLNRQLFLGLFSFESHFAHYQPGSFYKRHQDAFKGQANRSVSVVVYLNPAWGHADGGELVIYQDQEDMTGIRVVPLMGTVVVFLSEDFPHEVLPAGRDRNSIAGWFRVNTSGLSKVDPPT